MSCKVYSMLFWGKVDGCFFQYFILVLFHFVLTIVCSKVSSQFDSSSKSMLTSLVTQSHAVMPLHTVTPSQNVTPSSVTPSARRESPIALSDFAVKATSERLKAAVEEAKMQSERYVFSFLFSYIVS